MSDKLTIFNLLNFMPLNNKEKELFNFDKLIIKELNDKLDKGLFYLGGQIKMTHNEFISLDSIQLVREIDKIRYIEYGGPYNPLEAASIYNHSKKLEFIENMIIKYNEIMALREKYKIDHKLDDKLDETYFSDDI
jgi:hypothetical protein